MSKALEKAAEFIPFTPEQLAFMSLAAGSAGFGGMRLLTDLHNQMHPISPPNNSIKLELPNPRKKHENMESIDTASMDPNIGSQQPTLNKAADSNYDPSWWHPFAAVGLGLPVGFLGTKALYDTYQDHEYNKKIDLAKKQYIAQLTQAQNMNSKMAESTPQVDKLCEAMAEELEKAAGITDLLGKGFDMAGKTGIKKPTWPRFAGDLTGAAGLATGGAILEHGHNLGELPTNTEGPLTGQPIQLPTDAKSLGAARSEVSANSTQGFMDIINKVTGNIPVASAHILGGLGGASSLAMLGMLLHNHERKKEREMKGTYPTTIEYAS